MLVTLFLNYLATSLDQMVVLLPPWNITLGTGGVDQGTDHSVVYYGLFYIMQFDKFLPIHDGYATWISIILTMGAVFIVYRFILLVLNFLRGSGAK